MKYVIVGGVAGGATAAARIRRNTEKAEIILFERGEYISYAKDCLGNQTLKFKIQDCNDYDEMLQALIYDNDQDFKSVPLTNILVLLRKARKAEAVAKCHRELMT